MVRTMRAGAAGAIAGAFLGGGAAGGPDEPDTEALRLRVLELEERVMQLEGRDRLDGERARKIRALVEDVLADAEARASLLRGAGAGYDDGFVLESDDGKWRLRTNFLMQQRFVINSQDDDDQWAFENTRSRLAFSGHVVSPEWFYLLEIDFGSNGGGLGGGAPAPGLPADDRTGTLQAYLGYDFGNGFRVWGGSYTDRFLREEIVDAAEQLAVERSVVSYLFTTGLVDGAAVEYTGDKFRVWGAYSDGARTSQTSFDDANARFAFTVRGEYLFQGAWEQFDDFASEPGEDRGILVGGGLHYQTEDDGAPDLDLVALTVDGSFEFGGGNVFAAIMYSDQDAGGASGDQFGLVVQGGYQFADSWEAYGRLEWADTLDPDDDDLVILTVGINKYLAGHRAKWTTDLGISFNEVPLAPEVTGFRSDGPGDDGQIVIRTQLQIAF